MRGLTNACAVIGVLAFVILASALETRADKPQDAADADLPEQFDTYVKQLKHGGVQGRRQAVLALGVIGFRAKAALPALTDFLKHEDFAARRAAAEALWTFKKDAAAVTAMVQDLKNGDHFTRESAAQTLGRLGPEAKAAVPALVEVLKEADPFLRSAAALALWQIDKHPSALPALTENLKDSTSPGVRSRAAWALGSIGGDAKAAIPALAEALKDNPWTRAENSGFHTSVALALWQIDRHPTAIPALIECLKEPEATRRIEAAHGLGAIGADAGAAVPVLAELLKDEKSSVRVSAALALGAMGAKAKAAVPALLQAAQVQLTREPEPPPSAPKGFLGLLTVRAALHGEPYVEAIRDGGPADKAGLKSGDTIVGVNGTKVASMKEFRAAMDKLKLNPGDKIVFAVDRGMDQPVSITVTASEWPKAGETRPLLGFGPSRVAALEALWKINEHPMVVPGLAEILKDDQEGWRAAFALGRLGPKAKAAVPALVEALRAVNGATRLESASALGRIGVAAEAAPALVEAFKDKDGRMRCFAAAALWKIKKDPAAVAVLVKALDDPELRTDAAEALWKMNRHSAAVRALIKSRNALALGRIGLEWQASVTALAEALKDEDEQVRTSAADWLKKTAPKP
jgi:HEAT repeat protein